MNIKSKNSNYYAYNSYNIGRNTNSPVTSFKAVGIEKALTILEKAILAKIKETPIKTLEEAENVAKNIVEKYNPQMIKSLKEDAQKGSKNAMEELVNNVEVPLQRINSYFRETKHLSDSSEYWGYAAESLFKHIKNNQTLPPNVKNLGEIHNSGIAFFDAKGVGLFIRENPQNIEDEIHKLEMNLFSMDYMKPIQEKFDELLKMREASSIVIQ